MASGPTSTSQARQGGDGSRQCLYCGAVVPFLRWLTGGKCCSEEHRQLLQQRESLDLIRRIVGAPSSSPRRTLSVRRKGRTSASESVPSLCQPPVAPPLHLTPGSGRVGLVPVPDSAEPLVRFEGRVPRSGAVEIPAAQVPDSPAPLSALVWDSSSLRTAGRETVLSGLTPVGPSAAGSLRRVGRSPVPAPPPPVSRPAPRAACSAFRPSHPVAPAPALPGGFAPVGSLPRPPAMVLRKARGTPAGPAGLPPAKPVCRFACAAAGHKAETAAAELPVRVSPPRIPRRSRAAAGPRVLRQAASRPEPAACGPLFHAPDRGIGLPGPLSRVPGFRPRRGCPARVRAVGGGAQFAQAPERIEAPALAWAAARFSAGIQAANRLPRPGRVRAVPLETAMARPAAGVFHASPPPLRSHSRIALPGAASSVPVHWVPPGAACAPVWKLRPAGPPAASCAVVPGCWTAPAVCAPCPERGVPRREKAPFQRTKPRRLAERAGNPAAPPAAPPATLPEFQGQLTLRAGGGSAQREFSRRQWRLAAVFRPAPGALSRPGIKEPGQRQGAASIAARAAVPAVPPFERPSLATAAAGCGLVPERGVGWEARFAKHPAVALSQLRIRGSLPALTAIPRGLCGFARAPLWSAGVGPASRVHRRLPGLRARAGISPPFRPARSVAPSLIPAVIPRALLVRAGGAAGASEVPVSGVKRSPAPPRAARSALGRRLPPGGPTSQTGVPAGVRQPLLSGCGLALRQPFPLRSGDSAIPHRLWRPLVATPLSRGWWPRRGPVSAPPLPRMRWGALVRQWRY